MAEKVGRLGYLGLAIEATPGTPQGSPSVFIPFTENSLEGKHVPISDIASRASRVKDYSSVSGKRWGEGSVKMFLDSINAGYILKMAFGTEALTQKSATPPTYDHLLFPTVSGNTPTTGTLWDYKGVDTEQYAYATIEVCEIEVNNDGIATVNASIKAKAPATVAAPALTTTSGYLYTWKDMSAKFGSTVALANAATAIKLNNFKLAIKNNLELAYKTGSNQPDTIVMGPVEVTGEYTLFFENVTDRNNYYNLVKNTMVVTLTGADLGTGFNEQLIITLKKITIETIAMETGLDKLFAIKCNFRAEWDQNQAGYAEITVRNGKVTAY